MTVTSAAYVTDVEYMIGYFPFQSPAHLAVAALLCGVACDVLDRYETLSYVELGCGFGYGSMVLAASNPGWQVTGIDFNPAHIAAARSFAAEAGLTNITFIEADLSTLAEDPAAALVPEADVVTLHGVWSWVPEVVRAGIVRLLRAKLRSGGLAYVSYNALPAWQSALGMQRLVRESGARLAQRSDRQVRAGFGVAKELAAAEASHLKDHAFVKMLLERSDMSQIEYLAHEYMNGSWSPCFHGDLCADLAGARLNWVGSAALLENFVELNLTAAQRAVADQFEDPIQRELVKDLCLARGLRQDIFVRGARRLTTDERNAALGRVRLALMVPPGEFQYEADLPTGRAEFGRQFYGAVVAALAEGPKTVAELLCVPGRTSTIDNPAELIAVLVASEQAAIVAGPDAADPRAARRFNTTAARRLSTNGRFGQFAAAANAMLGNGLRGPLLELFVIDRTAAAGEAPDPAVLAGDLGRHLNEEERGQMRDAIASILAKRLPAWRSIGMV